MKTNALLCAILFAGALSACGDKPTDTTNTTANAAANNQQPAATVAIANPAAEFCQAEGGKVEIIANEQGQHSVCVLSSGERIDTWQHFRKHHPTPVGIANPADVFCHDQGGQVEMVTDDKGQHSMCVLADGEKIEAWQYFRQSQQKPIGMPNPAAVFCQQAGGEYLLADSDKGAAGSCVLASGDVVNAWDYFREQHAQTQE